MSIEKRADPFFLGFFAGARAIDIQDLKDLKRTRDVFSVARTMARGTRSHARGASEGPSPTMKGAFCRRCPDRRAALPHRDQEVSPTERIEI